MKQKLAEIGLKAKSENDKKDKKHKKNKSADTTHKTTLDYYAPLLAIMDENINSSIQSPFLQPDKLNGLFVAVEAIETQKIQTAQAAIASAEAAAKAIAEAAKADAEAKALAEAAEAEAKALAEAEAKALAEAEAAAIAAEAKKNQDKRMKAYDDFKKRVDEAAALESDGFYEKAAKLLETIDVSSENAEVKVKDRIKWNNHIKLLKMSHDFQLADTFGISIEEYVIRHIPEMPFRLQTVARAILSTTSMLQTLGIAAHNPLSYVAIGAHAYHTGDHQLLIENLEQDFNGFVESIKHPRENAANAMTIAKLSIEMFKKNPFGMCNAS